MVRLIGGSMKPYLVDLPDPTIKTAHDDNAFIHVGSFETEAEAIQWLLDVHGMPEDVAKFFITYCPQS